MKQININRQLLGIEDLLFGFGQVTQNRAGQSVTITKINAGNLPFDETQSLIQWAQNVNLAELGAMTDELQAIYDSIDTLNNLEDNLVALNILAQAINCLNNLCNNLTKLQNIDTNMTKLQNIDTNMAKLQNIDTNMTKLQNINTNMTKLSSIYSNMNMLQTVYDNMSNLNAINTQIIPHLNEILLVDDYAAQVSADKTTVANDKASVASMKLAVETIYDTFDDRFLGTKTSDPTLDNDGNPLLDGAMYFNTSVNALKVYDLGNALWVTIPQIYLSGLLDVTLTSITTGDILTWNGSKWINTRTPSFDSIKLNGGTGTNGTATWNNTEHTYDIVLNPNVTLQVGQEDLVYCKNNTASVIANGRPVMAVGTNGNSGNILVDLHDGTKTNARRIVGIATEDLTANGYGFVTRNGKVRGLNTTGSLYGETWVNGDILYVKATGNLTNVEPADTALKMPIAFVIHAHTNGTLYVRTTGIDENHDRDLIATKVSKVTSTDNAIVRFDGVNGVIQNSGVFIDDNNNITTTGLTSEYSRIKGNGFTGVFSTDTSGIYTDVGNTNYRIYTGGSERIRIDSAGNVGLGTVPSAWGSAYNAIEVSRMSIANRTSGNETFISNNSYHNGTNDIYKTTGYANKYTQQYGQHQWYTAPSGTAGNAITWNQAMILDASGNLTVGVSGSNCHNFRKNVTLNAGNPIFEIAESGSGNGWSAFIAYGVGAFGANSANSAVRIGKDAITSRSINAGGTINASGADYAEYEYSNDITLVKGQIVGFKADGTLTDKYSESIRFAIKSTNPSIVGGDVWGCENIVGIRPEKPVRKLDITEQKLIKDAVLGDDKTILEDAVYETVIIENGDSDKEWKLIYSTYEKDLADFEARLEAERQKVDRIAYAGKVPVNVYGAVAGQYVVAIEKEDGTIDGKLVNKSDMTFTEYQDAVGRVNKILDDGRAEVAVIIH